ncbi:NAD(P)H-dependent oxidoreductase [Spiractinospora alimapuensis]|uniref:NADPH-dependent FMN reductase n=1 Tax=Spiractinospora alimapuensis TaxID=2820884 RepID=UPI001F41D3A7|nr:NAD(P)H-dependent oxidoreductase [Spiractinospora alimapuensis]QVQ54323.1 NAD(P)H-dependent oxidoreductase [Spiractinospora alimapuensis]
MTNLSVLVAHSQPHSALRDAAVDAAGALAADAHLSTTPDVIDLAAFGQALLDPTPNGPVADAVDTVLRSEIIVVASPFAHGTYTGLLKVFLDRLPELALGHAVVVPVAAVPDLRNGHGVEEDLRLVFSDLGAWVAEPGLLLSESELGDPAGVVRAWAAVAAPALNEALAVGA